MRCNMLFILMSLPLCLHKKQPLIFLASLMVYSAALRFDIALFH